MSELERITSSQSVGFVSPADTVFQAALKMTSRKMGSVLVMDEGQLVGIFTERDLMNRVVAMGKDYRTTLVREVMSLNIKIVSRDESITDCYRIMKANRCRHLPIAGENKSIIGVVSMRDLLDSLVDRMDQENQILKKYITST